jgi:hypothetical protein
MLLLLLLPPPPSFLRSFVAEKPSLKKQILPVNRKTAGRKKRDSRKHILRAARSPNE